MVTFFFCHYDTYARPMHSFQHFPAIFTSHSGFPSNHARQPRPQHEEATMMLLAGMRPIIRTTSLNQPLHRTVTIHFQYQSCQFK